MSLQAFKTRLKLEIRHAIELVLVPSLAIFLPWKMAFWVFKFFSHWSFLYRNICLQALEQAKVHGWVDDEADWLARRRLVTLIDHADYYLARTRSNAWIARHFKIEGQWPDPGQAGILCTFHWGAGMWALRHAAAHGLKVHALVAPLDGAQFKGRRVLHGYSIARNAIVCETLGCDTLDVSLSLRPALKALRNKEQVLALVDVPTEEITASRVVNLLGQQARMPRGLLRVAVDQRIPLTLYLIGFDPRSGQRFLRIQQFGVYDDLDVLMGDVFSELDKVIRSDPPAWHFWSIADRVFVKNNL